MPTVPRLVAALLAVALAGCNVLADHDDLSLEQRPYLGDELRTDGYWYTSGPTPDGERHVALLLYRNGVVRYGGSSVGLDVLKAKIGLYGERRYHWGLFHVDGDRLIYEKWYPPSKTYTEAWARSARIVNDTTFVVTHAWRFRGSEADSLEREVTYRFRAFSPKPDSVSAFLE